ncbi:uncharacterized protein MYCFIDRAFT_80145 [Pseudocercospora fijiensis CIRAD86]|uniref:F-box domain-containing protein n=1 Tax=Pseudocercospora fijiensis (strain CIRAD86) TaxID=383855 RepID=N1QBW7_PSEFD|nr:uncharacterized protein MYCFIDRAFT_80145 [Pseudocercospora fijiensis CIRAD86]EME88777.1 hypothetical protein MYCFIDRAFT_80145 [Pseudocercospora fijiensis CIRAD86]
MARKRAHKRLHKGYMLSDLNIDTPKPETAPKEPESPVTPPSEQKPFRLLDLPDELVLKILEFAVVHSTRASPIHVNSSITQDEDISAEELRHRALSGRPYKKRTWALVQPAITRTCRFLRTEGTKTFYQSNHFFSDSSTDGIEGLMKWLKCLSDQQISTIRRMYVQWVQDYDHFNLITDLPLHDLRWKHFSYEVEWLLDHDAMESLPFHVYFKIRDGIPVMSQNFPACRWSYSRMSRTLETPCYEFGFEPEGAIRRDGDQWLLAKVVAEMVRDDEEMCWVGVRKE